MMKLFLLLICLSFALVVADYCGVCGAVACCVLRCVMRCVLREWSESEWEWVWVLREWWEVYHFISNVFLITQGNCLDGDCESCLCGNTKSSQGIILLFFDTTPHHTIPYHTIPYHTPHTTHHTPHTTHHSYINPTLFILFLWSQIDISILCSKFSSWSQTCCECIVSQESGGNANAINNTHDGQYKVGLFQIPSNLWSVWYVNKEREGGRERERERAGAYYDFHFIFLIIEFQ